jgi:hypothetical protein
MKFFVRSDFHKLVSNQFIAKGSDHPDWQWRRICEQWVYLIHFRPRDHLPNHLSWYSTTEHCSETVMTTAYLINCMTSRLLDIYKATCWASIGTTRVKFHLMHIIGIQWEVCVGAGGRASHQKNPPNLTIYSLFVIGVALEVSSLFVTGVDWGFESLPFCFS